MMNSVKKPLIHGAVIALASALLAACGGSDDARGTGGCSGFCATDNPQNLSQADVKQVISQALFEAEAQGVLDLTVAVSDRVGNILAVYRSIPIGTASTNAVTITSTNGDPTASDAIAGGLENISFVPTGQAAIAKALTGAYLSTEGNAFSTRTANQIIQDHFNPGEFNQPGGPLFGVQFSQLPCSDLVRRRIEDNGANRPGPKRSPLGFSADPGGFPLYKNGTPVGGVGIIADFIYGADKDLSGPLDSDLDETIAIAALTGFEAPVERQAERITVDGKVFRYSDATGGNLLSTPSAAPDFDDATSGAGQAGRLEGVRGYFRTPNNPPSATGAPVNDADILVGTAFSAVESGVASVANPPAGASISAETQTLFASRDAFILLDENGDERFPPMAGTDETNLPDAPIDVSPLSQLEVETILQEALDIAQRGRAQIRRPLSSPIAVSVTVVDSNGTILGLVRTRDAPMFGIDVALQKARTATLFSSGPKNSDASTVAGRLTALPDAEYLNETFVDPDGAGPQAASPALRTQTPNLIAIGDYVTSVQQFLSTATGDNNALTNGAFAFADRSGGNLSRPYFPDGIDANSHGPFSKARGEWSIFSDGLQLDLVYNATIQHVLFSASNGAIPDVLAGCVEAGAARGSEALRADRSDECACVGVNEGIDNGFAASAAGIEMREIANGIQIFPGSVPIYRGDTLIGGIGVSGDGIDQDDMISFLGLHNASQVLAAGGSTSPPQNAPLAIRADNLSPRASDGLPNRLRYVNCPQSPFRDSNEQEVCDGK